MLIFEERKTNLELEIENTTCWEKYLIKQEESEEGIPIYELWDGDKIALSITTEIFIPSKDFLCIPLDTKFTFYHRDLEHYYKVPYDSQFNGDGFSALVDFNNRWLAVCVPLHSNVEVYELDRADLKFKKLELSISINRMNLMSNPQHEHPIYSSGMILSRGDTDEFFSWEALLGKNCEGKSLRSGINVAYFDPGIYVAQDGDDLFAYDLKTMKIIWVTNHSYWYFGSPFLTDDTHVCDPKYITTIFTASAPIVAITRNDNGMGYIVWTC